MADEFGRDVKRISRLFSLQVIVGVRHILRFLGLLSTAPLRHTMAPPLLVGGLPDALPEGSCWDPTRRTSGMLQTPAEWRIAENLI